MRSLLLFIGSVLYPIVMVIISPVLAFVYLFLGTIMFTRYVKVKSQWLFSFVRNLNLQFLHLSYKKQLSYRPKAVRLH